VGFYAKKLCMAPKYLSAVIKEKTGKSAFEWINDYVILEAKSLLKSTNMTIQQISDELNFANQSFFGKYFKRLAGMSPKSYRGEG
jgi:AraC-like DNA-binding protein